MAETGWTKGPWQWAGGIYGYIADADGHPVKTHGRSHEAAANRRLKAAAPDMAEALEAMIERYTSLVNCGDCGNWNPEEEPQVIAARTALARARGQEQERK